ncbi:MAG: DUF1080 domain-containing protein [Bacteroidia bacterium]|nr:DUF1080 domain-containing protein [Bacteroidia bacterium]
MKKLILFCIVISVTVTGFSQKGMKSLFNGKNLKGWNTYIGPKEKGGVPIGLNADPLKIFTIAELDGVKVLHISGEVNASIATAKEYENYHVRMVFKWGNKVYSKLNSGLLYHSYGPFGAGLDVWMSSHEFQLCTGKMGDSYCMGKSYFEIPAIKSDDGKTFTYSASGVKTQFGQGKTAPIAAKSADYEKPKGEWNVIDLYCFGRTSVHVVNGKVNMVNYNSGKIENGKVLPLTKGKIQIQSEGGELFVKSLEWEPIKEIPAEFLK